MTTKVEKEEKLAEPPQKPEKKFDPSEYSCEILQEKTTHEKANDRKLPSDAFNVTYVVEGETLLDVTRSSKMVNVFDMYYDRYGKDCVQKIDFGHGTINPGQWGYKAPTKKVKKKKMSDELRDQINDIIEGEIQNGINDYIENQGKGFKGQELKVNVSQDEIDKIIKEYKKLKKKERSNLSQVKRMGLTDKDGKPL